MSDQSSQPDVEKRPPNNNLLFAIVILVVIACAAAFVLLSSEEQPQPVVEKAPVEQPIQEYKAPEPEVPSQSQKLYPSLRLLIAHQAEMQSQHLR